MIPDHGDYKCAVTCCTKPEAGRRNRKEGLATYKGERPCHRVKEARNDERKYSPCPGTQSIMDAVDHASDHDAKNDEHADDCLIDLDVKAREVRLAVDRNHEVREHQ